MQLENKVAFITGGGSGLGLAAAETFIAEGAKVMIFDFNPKSQEVADEIGAKFVQGDVSKAESVEAPSRRRSGNLAALTSP
jgi:NAD(P)-dependent dehydrogenase (short-subunit alcohol dehydrogenase family)